MSTDQRDQVARAVDIVALVSEYVTLRRHGREYQGLCPFHAERTPSFSVNAEKGFWYCHGCHEGGDAVSFVSKIEGVSRGQAFRQLAERQGISLQRDSSRGSIQDEERKERLMAACAEAARFYQQQLAGDEAHTARSYLRNRGIDRSCAESFGLGFAPTAPDSLYRRLVEAGFTLEETEEAGLCLRGDYGPYDRMRERLIIPIGDAQGHPIAFGGRSIGDGSPKYLNSPDSLLFHKSRTLYLLHRARRAIQQQGSVVIVEGYMDALVAHYYGIDNVVATLGTAITPQHVQTLHRLAKRVILALDSDPAGVHAVEKASSLVDQEGLEVLVASFPEGMDPDAFLRSFGPDQFRERLSTALGAVEYQLAQVLRQADLSTPAGKTAAVQECSRILGTVRSPLLRDRYVDDLARLWAGAQATGPTLLDNIEVIRDEVTRQARTRVDGRRRTSSHRLADSEGGSSRAQTEQGRAEAGLLAAIVKRPSLLMRCEGILSPDDFKAPSHRSVFEALLAHGALDEWMPTMEDEDAVRTAARVLAASEAIVDEEQSIQQIFIDCLRKVKDFDIRVRYEELRRKFEQMAAGNPDVLQPQELQEYSALTRRLKVGVSEQDPL